MFVGQCVCLLTVYVHVFSYFVSTENVLPSHVFTIIGFSKCSPFKILLLPQCYGVTHTHTHTSFSTTRFSFLLYQCLFVSFQMIHRYAKRMKTGRDKWGVADEARREQVMEEWTKGVLTVSVIGQSCSWMWNNNTISNENTYQRFNDRERKEERDKGTLARKEGQ